MVIGSNAIIMDYKDARFLRDVLRRINTSFEPQMNEDEQKAYLKFQEAVREIESSKFGEDD